jgi:hypothetical protein
MVRQYPRPPSANPATVRVRYITLSRPAAPVLAGAVVEGPNKTTSRGLVSGMRTCPVNGVDVFAPFNATPLQDDVQSWSTDEPAIDLSATSPLAFARQAAGLN